MDTKSAAGLDVLATFIDRLASSQRENPLLLRQGESRYLRREVAADGSAQDVYRFGRTSYWLTAEGRLVRAEAALGIANGITRVTLSEHGPTLVQLPPARDVIDRAALGSPTSRSAPPTAPSAPSAPPTTR